jgi:hypothetical protein
MCNNHDIQIVDKRIYQFVNKRIYQMFALHSLRFSNLESILTLHIYIYIYIQGGDNFEKDAQTGMPVMKENEKSEPSVIKTLAIVTFIGAIGIVIFVEPLLSE